MSGKRPSSARGRRSEEALAVVGWREWVCLPDLGIRHVKAKIDTGARSSALHAYDMRRFTEDGRTMVRFKVHPIQRSTETTVEARGELVDERVVRSSAGAEQLRPVIRTPVELMGHRWPIELTLTRRDTMGFRMLFGRQALRGRFLIDPGRSFVAGRGPESTGRGPKTGRGARSVAADEAE